MQKNLTNLDSLSTNNISVNKPTFYMLKQSIDNNSGKINDSLNNYGDSLNAKYFFIYAVKYNNQATVSGQFPA